MRLHSATLEDIRHGWIFFVRIKRTSLLRQKYYCNIGHWNQKNIFLCTCLFRERALTPYASNKNGKFSTHFLPPCFPFPFGARVGSNPRPFSFFSVEFLADHDNLKIEKPDVLNLLTFVILFL